MTRLHQRLSFKRSLELFLIIAFPIHVWAILSGLQNIQVVVERTSNWAEGPGYMAYVLLTALIESLLLFAVFYLLNFLLPDDYSADRRVVQLGTLATVFNLWMILEQLFNLFAANNPGAISQFVLGFERPYLTAIIGLATLLGLIVVSVAVPFRLIHRSHKLVQGLRKTYERLAPLAGFYLALDVAGVLLILVRNI